MHRLPLKIIANFVVETSRRISLPLDEFFLKPIAGNLTQSLKIKKNNKKIGN
jgi:hypothetical protein